MLSKFQTEVYNREHLSSKTDLQANITDVFNRQQLATDPGIRVYDTKVNILIWFSFHYFSTPKGATPLPNYPYNNFKDKNILKCLSFVPFNVLNVFVNVLKWLSVKNTTVGTHRGLRWVRVMFYLASMLKNFKEYHNLRLFDFLLTWLIFYYAKYCIYLNRCKYFPKVFIGSLPNSL